MIQTSEKVILAYDGTPESEKAAIRTREVLGAHPDEELIVVTIVPCVGECEHTDEQISEQMAEAKEALKKKVKELTHLGYKAQGVVTEGDVVEILLNMVEYHQPKMLVIARADYESYSQHAIDSAADELSRKAACPVLIVT